MSVLITNAGSSKGLVIGRALGEQGVDVYAGGTTSFTPFFYSRYLKKKLIYPDSETMAAEFISSLEDFISDNNIDVLMPVNSTETLLVSKNKDVLSKYAKVPVDEYDKMFKLHDKLSLSTRLSELDIPHPQTFSIKSLDELESISSDLNYPVVIKLRESTSSRGLSIIPDKESLLKKYLDVVEKYGLTENNLPIIQEYVEGVGYGVSCLFNHGEMRAFFTHRRIREYPVTGGPSTLRISIKEKKLEDYAINLLSSENWHGVAMVEFKMDVKSGKAYVLEVNPRFWGSVPLAIYSGVNFPHLLYNMAVEGDIKTVTDYKVGVEARNLLNDLRAIVASSPQTGVVSTFKGLVNLLNPRVKLDILTLHDPLPSLLYPLYKIYG